MQNEFEKERGKNMNTINSMKERVVLMVQLFRKNVNKVSHLGHIIAKEETNKTPSKDLLLKEFTSALENFNKVLNNPKILSLFEKETQEVEIEVVNEEADFSHFEVIKKLEGKCKKIEKEKQKYFESSENYLLKYNDLKVTYDETQKQLSELKKAKLDLDKNYSDLREDNETLRQQINIVLVQIKNR